MTAKALARKPVREAVRADARSAFRDAILTAAQGVFARSGFYETRMADIARAARVGVGTLYNYFESKEVIFSELIELHHDAFQARVTAAASARDPVERLRQMVEACLGYFDEHGALLAIFLERGAIGEFDVERLAGERAADRYGELLDRIEKTIRAAIRSGKIRSDVDPRLLVAMLSGAMNGAMYAWLQRGRRGQLAHVAKELFEVFLEGACCP